MVRKLSISSDSLKFVKQLEPRHYKQVLQRVFGLISDPVLSDSAKLTGFSYHRVDQGEYRIIYSFDTETIHIVLIGKRNDDEVYKQIKRK